VKFTPRSSISIPDNRQRREFDPDAHQELISSLEGPAGLMHPPVLRSTPKGLVLVAGERRLRAMDEMWELGTLFTCNGEVVPAGMVPYNHLGDLSELDARAAELEENIRRKDLTWAERAKAESDLLTLREDQAKAAGAPLPHVSVVAQETRGKSDNNAITAVTRSVLLAQNLHRPEVAGAKSAKEAYKILGRIEETERNAELATALGKEFLGGKHRLHNWDCVEWLRQQPPGEFDVILSDPPYGMGADEFGDSGGGAQGAHFYDDSYESWLELMAAVIPELGRVTKPDAHLYFFCDFDRFPELKAWLGAQGWTVFRTPLLWFKPSAFRAPWPEHGPQRKYETILYARRGELKCVSLKGDVLTYPPDENLGHQAQKPIELYKDLLSRSARPGMKVLDPFCGTGPIFPAAHALRVIATGVEQDPAAFAIAATRLQKLKGEK
jgi:site-specific DNA-methyltransferase (adenine-specific)